MKHAAFAALLSIAALAGCRRARTRPTVPPSITRTITRTDWGLLPRTADALSARLAIERTRATTAPVVVDARTVEAALSDPRAIAGWDAVLASLRHRLGGASDAYLLLGVFHDARAHVEAFRRLIVDLPITHALAEPLEAASGFRDAPHDGDDRLLARFRATGARADLAAFEALHRTHDATAIKFGWIGAFVDLVATARGLGVPLLGCDLPRELRPPLSGDELLRLRELHCALAMRDALRSAKAPRRIAVMWGAAHVGADAFRALLPAGALAVAIHVVGGRPAWSSPSSTEEALAGRLTALDPVLAPLGADDLVLILPDERIGGEIDRARTVRAPSGPPGVTVTSSVGGTITIGGVAAALAAEAPARIAVASGSHVFRYQGARTLVGEVSVPASGEAELELDPPSRSARVVSIAPP